MSEYMETENAGNICERFGRLYTPLISDTADHLGVKIGVLDSGSGIEPVDGDRKVVAGVAFPCRNEPTGEWVDIDRLLEMLDALPSGAFVVVAGDSLSGAAQWGGLMSRRALAQGAVGALCNGPVRDVAQIQKLGFPVFASGRTVFDIRGRSEMVEYGVPVNLGNVVVRPDDIIVADQNGVVVVPHEHAEMLVEQCEQAKVEEEKTDRALSEGGGAAEVYRCHGRF